MCSNLDLEKTQEHTEVGDQENGRSALEAGDYIRQEIRRDHEQVMETFDSEASAITPVRDGERAQDIIRNKRGEAEGEVTVADHPDDRHAVMFACVVVNRDAAVDDADQQEVRQRR